MVTGGRGRYDLSQSRVGMRTWEKENDEYPTRRVAPSTIFLTQLYLQTASFIMASSKYVAWSIEQRPTFP